MLRSVSQKVRSSNTWLTGCWQNAGLTPEEIKKIAVPKIADRTALLESGELKAAVMPDPLASLLMQKGAVLVIDDTTLPEVSNSVYSFSVETLNNYPKEVRAFLARR